MGHVKVTTQSEFDRAVAAGYTPEVYEGEFTANNSVTVHARGSATAHAHDSATVYARNSATVCARDSAIIHVYGSATVDARDSATIHVYGSATVHARGSATVYAYGSATVYVYDSAKVHAYGSATVHAYDSATVYARNSATVHAYGSATVHAYDSATVSASKYVAVHVHATGSSTPAVIGGVQIVPPSMDSVSDWCDYVGVNRANTHGEIVVFKAVNDELKSERGFAYPIGQQVACTGWEPKRACGNGLHFSPTPALAKSYFPEATRFLACEVSLEQAVVLGADKIKAPSAKVLHEVDIDGQLK